MYRVLPSKSNEPAGRWPQPAGYDLMSERRSMMTSGRQIGLRIAICACAVLLLLCAIWILLPEIYRRGTAGYSNSGTTGALNTANERAARSAVVRGDLWTELALNNRELAWPK